LYIYIGQENAIYTTAVIMMHKCFSICFMLAYLLLNKSVSAIRCYQGQYSEIDDEVIVNNLRSVECFGDSICHRYDITTTWSGVKSKKIINDCNAVLFTITSQYLLSFRNELAGKVYFNILH